MRLKTDITSLRRATDAKEFGRVAVLLGGDSTEREISLLSGNAVLAALQRRGVDAYAFDPSETSLPKVTEFDRVWIALHGPRHVRAGRFRPEATRDSVQQPAVADGPSTHR